MPQFDFAHVFWPQLAWLAVFFIILYFGIVRATLPKVGGVMDARDDQVREDLANAEQAKAGADALAVEYDAGVAGAQDAARAQLASARSAAAASVEARLAASNALLDDRATQAQAALNAARARAMGEIEAVAADAAADIVEKLTGARPASAAVTAAARAALG
ncbi:MAG: ATPase [Sphingomonas sp.]|jgi:F-type H+-transporting ATPase subunit b